MSRRGAGNTADGSDHNERMRFAMAEHQLACAGCGAQFTYHRRKKYCTPRCRPGLKPKGTDRHARHANSVCKQDHECKLCGATFRPKASDRTTCCSRECGVKYQALMRSARATRLIVSHVVHRKNCTECGKRFSTSRAQVRRCMSCIEANPKAYNPVKGTTRSCAHCGGLFTAMSGEAFSSTKWCSKPCKNAYTRAKSWYKEMQKAAKAKRRAAKRGAKIKEAVKPSVVFERDGWRCQICNCKTPQRLRGTYDKRAPELDHIVPISQGGEHSYQNTQCLCRACNAAKSDGAGGQLRLFG